MITVSKLIERLKAYVDMQINDIARNNPMMGFIKPMISRAASNYINKADKTLSLLADEKGEIDVDSLLTEMIENLMTTTPFTINTSFIGDIVIGNGAIKLDIPYTGRNLVFNTSDLQALKEMLITKC